MKKIKLSLSFYKSAALKKRLCTYFKSSAKSWYLFFIFGNIFIVVFFFNALSIEASSLKTQFSERFYENQQQGWFWYKEPILIEEAPLIEMSELSKKENMLPDAAELSSAWFRENLQAYLDKAIDEPSIDNIKRYLSLQKIMMNKGERFSMMTEHVVMQYPQLDERNRRPLAPFASQALDKIARNNKEKLLSDLSHKTGIYFFYRSDCPYCHIQAPILKALSNQFNLTILPIALDAKPLPNHLFDEFIKDTGEAKALNVSSVPTLFLMGQDKVLPLAQGVLSYEELIDKLLITSLHANLISNEEFDSTKAINTSPEAFDDLEILLKTDISDLSIK